MSVIAAVGDKHNDHGATYHFDSTKPDPILPVYRDRPSMSLLLTRKSV